MRFIIKHKGSFKNTERYLNRVRKLDPMSILRKYGERGVSALTSVTPRDTGTTATSWYYEVTKTKNGYRLSWNNSEAAGQTPLVILLHYGHGTRGGTYIPGRDFINPALRPIIEQLSAELRKEVSP